MTETDHPGRLQSWLSRWSLETADQLEGWLSGLSPRHLDAEEFLLRAGEESDTLYLLESGLVR